MGPSTLCGCSRRCSLISSSLACVSSVSTDVRDCDSGDDPGDGDLTGTGTLARKADTGRVCRADVGRDGIGAGSVEARGSWSSDSMLFTGRAGSEAPRCGTPPDDEYVDGVSLSLLSFEFLREAARSTVRRTGDVVSCMCDTMGRDEIMWSAYLEGRWKAGAPVKVAVTGQETACESFVSRKALFE